MKVKHNKQIRFFSNIPIPVIGCLFACILLYGMSYFIERSFEKYAIAQSVAELNSVADSIERELSYYNRQEEPQELIQNILLILASHHQLFVYIVDEKDNILYKTRGPNLLAVHNQINMQSLIGNRSTSVWKDGNYSYRIAVSQSTTIEKETFTIIIATNQDLQVEFIHHLHDGLLILIVIACLLSLLGTMLTIYITQKPINQLIKKIEAVTTKSLDYRIPTSSVPTKYVSLVEAFNNMLSRMEIVFQRQSDFTADIAHEMRTPITNLTTQTQIALNNARTSNEYKEVLYSHLEEFERLSQIITDMLFLARADNKLLVPQLTEINMTNIFTALFDYYEFISEEKNINLELKGHCPSILGDRLMLARAISNLLSNALRYTPPQETITATLCKINNNTIKAIIANPGKKVDEKHLPHLFERFYRVDESRQRNGEGSGIGLAIVKSIVEAHNGTIAVESDDISTRFIMKFPTSQQLPKE